MSHVNTYHLPIVGPLKCLLARGADAGLWGRWGKCVGTPADFARQRAHKEAALFIEEYQRIDEQEGEDVDEGDKVEAVEAAREVERLRRDLEAAERRLRSLSSK